MFFGIFRLRVLSSGVKSFELTNRNAKKDLQEITTLVSVFLLRIQIVLINYITK